MRTAPERDRRDLIVGLEGRRAEIEDAVGLRVRAIDGPIHASDTHYREGLRTAIRSAIDHTIEAGEVRLSGLAPVPDSILSQARMAARRRVPAETMLRRYLAGHAVLNDFVIEEGERRGIPATVLKAVLRSQMAATDRALTEISSAYTAEKAAATVLTAERRKADQVQRLLDGELVDPACLNYDFEQWHLALAVRGLSGKDVGSAVSDIDALRLVITIDDGITIIWLGSRRRIDPSSVESKISVDGTEGRDLGIGEPAHGASGWRLTHNQAQAALSVATRSGSGLARYGDVALLAAALQDELLGVSLRQLYVSPLADRAGGDVLLETLRAYFQADQSITSTAAALSVSRNTVANRLKTIEGSVGSLGSFRVADCMVALRLSDLSNRPKQGLSSSE